MQGVLVGDDTDEEQHQGRSHQVQRRTADGLVRPQIYGGKAQQQGENGAEYGRHQHSQQLKALQSHPVAGSLGRVVDVVGLHDVHEQHADKRTQDHNTFQRQVDDTAALSEHAGQRHDHQGNGVDHGLLDQKCHACSPPSSGCSGTCGASFIGMSGMSSGGASSGCVSASAGISAVVVLLASTTSFFSVRSASSG